MYDKLNELANRITKIVKVRQPKRLIVSFSGGKDSTLLTEVVLRSIKNNLDSQNKYVDEFIIVNLDTRLEYPMFYELLNIQFDRIKSFINSLQPKFNLKLEVIQPDVRNTFQFYTIGKGYTLPDSRIKQCQSSMKINTFKKQSKQFNPATDIFLVGTRQDESSARKKILSKFINQDIYLHQINYLEVYTPLYDITTKEVWELLRQLVDSNENILDVQRVIQLYSDVKQHLECTKGIKCEPRFGCQVCTVIRKDRTIEALIKATKDSKLKELAKFKQWMIDFYNKPVNHTDVDRKGNKRENILHGVLKFKARKKLLKELLKLQNKIGIKLISDDEIKAIERQQQIDKRRPQFT